jgi:hypothetical protein
LHVRNGPEALNFPILTPIKMPSITAGKALLSFLGVFTIIGPFIADWKYVNYISSLLPSI